MKIHMIVAMSSNMVIGKDNNLPWPKLKPDLQHFKSLTTGHPVIMGRKTFESLGRPTGLPGRDNFVLTTDVAAFKDAYPYVSAANNFVDLLHNLKEFKKYEKIYIIGGASIYEQAEPYADEINMTFIYKEFEGDVKFPFNPEYSRKWKFTRPEGFKPLIFDESSGLGFAFFDYKRSWWQRLIYQRQI